MVIVPTLLTTVTEVDELVERLEVAALANAEPRIHFAILSDFPDAPEPRDARGRGCARGRQKRHRGIEWALWNFG